MEIIKNYLNNGQYLTALYEKFSIFLHHTVSTTWKSAWRWWNSTPERVGTPYMIGRDGSIHELFDPNMWAYHLGVKNDDDYHEKHSINIEIVSAGPLRLVEGEYRFYPLWPNKLRYTVIDKSEVYEFEKPWKGFKYWHAYTKAQITSVKWLIGKILLDHPSIQFENDIEKIFEYNPNVVKDHLKGIWTHNTVRADKSDIFPYPPLIEALEEVQEEIIGVKSNVQIPEVIKVAKSLKKTSNKSTKS